MSEIQEITIVVKWSAKEYPINDLTDQDTVAVLRHEIFKKTQVRPERQKLLNLKYKGESPPLGNIETLIECLYFRKSGRGQFEIGQSGTQAQL